ncbi:MAG: alpha/beta fold hydrolase [Rhodospirillaceae bacterium]|jgi:predicted dienelactone hydrolase|nr:alpha/beta fold hydrolase [Rhodospirillaceae bacterium]
MIKFGSTIAAACLVTSIPMAGLSADHVTTYDGTDGPYTVAYTRDLELNTPERVEPLTIQVARPVDVDRSPLIVFSHGFRCELDGNDPLVAHWASHGYTVIQPRHLDAEPGSKAGDYPQHVIWQERRLDMVHSLDLLDQITTAIPELTDTLDLSTIIAAGHSYGGLTAQSAAGATTYSRDDDNAPVYEPDPRFKSVIAVSPPGYMPGFVDENSAKTIDHPMIVTTGTKDFIPPMMPTWEVHANTYHDAVPGDKYLAVVDGADHRFGGLICGNDGSTPMLEQLSTLKSATLAFADYYVRGTYAAKVHLDGLVDAGQTATMFAFESK